MAMLTDLRFYDDTLEAHFEEALRESKSGVVVGFAVFRFFLLIVATLRSVLNGRWRSREMLFLVGAVSNVLPLLAARARWGRHARAWQWGVALVDVVQAAIGCLNHASLAHSAEGIRPLPALVYLSYGSTSLWLLSYTTFSFLPFWLEVVKAAAVSMVQLAFNGRLCRSSPGLRTAYSTLHTLLTRAGRRGLLRRSAWLSAVFHGSGGGDAGTALPTQQQTVWLCSQYQMHVVLATFITAAWLVHRSERRMRLGFLRRCVRLAQEQQELQQRPAAVSQADLAVAAAVAAAEEADAGSAISDIDFLIGFGIPSALGMLLVFSIDW